MKKFTDKFFHHEHHDHDEEKQREEEDYDEKLDKHVHPVHHETKAHSFSTATYKSVTTHTTTPTTERSLEQTTILPSIIHEHINPPIVDTIIRPTIVEETIRREKVIEIQPIVHRRVDVPEVHHIEKHVYEKLPPAGPALITKQTIIEETVQPHITEDIRTVVHREVPQQYIVHEEKHLTEHIIKPTIHTSEVIQEQTPVVLAKPAIVETTTTTTNIVTEKLPTLTLEKHEGAVQQPFTAAGGAPRINTL